MDNAVILSELESIANFMIEITRSLERVKEAMAPTPAKPGKPLIGKPVKPSKPTPPMLPAHRPPAPVATPADGHPSLDDVPLKLWSRAQLVSYCWELGYTEDMTRGKAVKELQEMINAIVAAGTEEPHRDTEPEPEEEPREDEEGEGEGEEMPIIEPTKPVVRRAAPPRPTFGVTAKPTFAANVKPPPPTPQRATNIVKFRPTQRVLS
jgi:hypothetical protein